MNTEFKGGFSGGLRYALGVMSFQLAVWPPAGATADTDMIRRATISRPIESFHLLIEINSYYRYVAVGSATIDM